jgi:bifunctional non-homologous end joining protein LigD
MLATPHEGAADDILDGARWVFERKLDGMRILALVEPGTASPRVQLWTRNGHEKGAQFPELVKDLKRFARTLRRTVLIDGEVVALDRRGHVLGFQRLAGRIHLTASGAILGGAAKAPVAYVAFDLLREGADDLRPLPLVQRRARLEKVIGNAGSEQLRLGDQSAGGEGRRWLASAQRGGWEGLIAKDAESPYVSGKRSPAWRKLKLPSRQEFVVGGWTQPRGVRQHFGSLLVGYHDGEAAGRRLRYAGSVGSGYDGDELDRLWGLLQERATKQCPFAQPPSPPERPSWVRPDLVVEVKFTEWTDEGYLRHPVYLGQRHDVDPETVRREPSPLRGAAAGRGPATGPVGPRAAAPARPVAPAPPGRPAARAPVPPASTRRPARRSRATARGLPADAGLDAVIGELQALEDARRDGTVALPDGHVLAVTNLSKVLWPVPAITKGELLRYYARVSPWILPVVADRPLIMKRFPNGVAGKTFYQQRAPDEVPGGVRAEWVEDDGEGMPRLVGGGLTTLLYMAQLAAISQDPWFSRVQSRSMADYAALDLDPMPGVPFAQVRAVARAVGDQLEALGVLAVPKTSGASGLHVYIPLVPGTSYEAAQLFCQIVATLVATKLPALATVERAVARRGRKVYVDYLQNSEGKSLATAYSARASEFAGVSTPLRWEELTGDVHPEDFTLRTVFARFESTGDLWAGVGATRRADLRGALEKLAARS